MRFLIDNNCSPWVVPVLIQLGHFAVHVRDLGLGAATDAVIIDRARQDGLIIVTRDGDFGEMLIRGHLALPRVLWFKQGSVRYDPALFAEQIHAIAERFAWLIAEGVLLIIDEERIRARPLSDTTSFGAEESHG